MRIGGQPRHHDSKKQVPIVSSENYSVIATRLSRVPQSGLVQSAFCGELQNAEFERETIHQRSIHGLQKARERGVIGGAAPRWTDKQILAAVKQHGTYDKAAKALKCSRITIIRRMEKMHKTRKAKKAKSSMTNEAETSGSGRSGSISH